MDPLRLAMKPIVALRHVPHEGLGLLEERLPRARARSTTSSICPAARRARFSPDQLAGLVVLGGPMNVDQSGPLSVSRGRSALDSAGDRRHDCRCLGICLGSQLLAKALARRVYANDVKEIGWYPIDLTGEAARDALFSGLRTRRRTCFPMARRHV